MKQVIFVNNSDEKTKPVVFTDFLSNEGNVKTSTSPSAYEKIAYLGKDFYTGRDLFAAYNTQGLIVLYLGKLNSGMY